MRCVSIYVYFFSTNQITELRQSRWVVLKAEPLCTFLAGLPKTKKLIRLPMLTTEQMEASHTLIVDVTSPPVLALPKKDCPYSVDSDASTGQVGGLLLQTHEYGKRWPLGY